MAEGNVKYAAKHTISPPLEVPHWASINDARTRLHTLGLVGVTQEGIGFGNVSIRYRENEFLISGTSTGSLPELTPREYCLVSAFDLEQNQVISSGPVKASSESMTHGAVYQACANANCVIHIHSRKIFDAMLGARCVCTPKDAEYGTPEIALAIGKCVRESGKDEGQIVLAGHDEGVIAYGPNVERALDLVLDLYDKYGG
jgi:ribulose-5-phosphate 4-epimerase/fuculose-1-phosphate aldolase